jgi:hypothetical protein
MKEEIRNNNKIHKINSNRIENQDLKIDQLDNKTTNNIT